MTCITCGGDMIGNHCENREWDPCWEEDSGPWYCEESVLDRLRGERVLGVVLADDKKTAIFMENCDGHFVMDLSKADMVKLIEELKDIMEVMV